MLQKIADRSDEAHRIRKPQRILLGSFYLGGSHRRNAYYCPFYDTITFKNVMGKTHHKTVDAKPYMKYQFTANIPLHHPSAEVFYDHQVLALNLGLARRGVYNEYEFKIGGVIYTEYATCATEAGGTQ